MTTPDRYVATQNRHVATIAALGESSKLDPGTAASDKATPLLLASYKGCVPGPRRPAPAAARKAGSGVVRVLGCELDNDCLAFFERWLVRFEMVCI